MGQTQHFNRDEAKDAFLERFNESLSSDHWAAAVWRIHEGRVELVRLTTYQFPHGDALAAVGLLSHSFAERQNMATVPDPLPIATGFLGVIESAVVAPATPVGVDVEPNDEQDTQ